MNSSIHNQVLPYIFCNFFQQRTFFYHTLNIGHNWRTRHENYFHISSEQEGPCFFHNWSKECSQAGRYKFLIEQVKVASNFQINIVRLILDYQHYFEIKSVK